MPAILWIPAFAGMTERRMGEWICRLRFLLDFGRRAWLEPSGFPLSRE